MQNLKLEKIEKTKTFDSTIRFKFDDDALLLNWISFRILNKQYNTQFSCRFILSSAKLETTQSLNCDKLSIFDLKMSIEINVHGKSV